MSGRVARVEPERVDAFAAVFAWGPNLELDAAKKEAERSVAAVRKAAALAAQLATKQPAPPQAAPAAPPKPNPLEVVQQIAAQLGQHLQAAAGKPDQVAAYKKVKADADKALGTMTKAVDAARTALATAEKANMDRLPDDVARKARFTALAADAGGRQIIDGMVEGIGSKASGQAAKTFVADALRARFDVELTGDLTTKALPRIYKLMTRVPESHTTFNEGLNAINRQQTYMPGTSDYAGGGTINLRCGRAGAAGVGLNFLKNVDGIGAVNHFDFTTLHEVGHSVNGRFPSDHYAAWQSVTYDQLITIMLNTKGFRAVPGYPPEFLSLYLTDVVNKREPEKSARLKQIFADARTMVSAAPTRADLLADPAITEIQALRAMPNGRPRTDAINAKKLLTVISKLQGDSQKIGTLVCLALLSSNVLTPADAVDQVIANLTPAGAMPAQPDWPALSKHAAVAWFRSIRMKSDTNGLWGSPGDSEKAAVAGRVYQESYANVWASYDISARADRVSNYQFRAGPEWFADLYGVYYSGKLPKNHKYYSWFKDVIDQ